MDKDTATGPEPTPCFGIQVIDQQTRRGVPLIELRTTNGVSHYTDSAGWIAFAEPGMMGTDVFFHVEGHGYSHPKDEHGFAAVVLHTTPGATAVVQVQRDNIAQRLYRITGAGIYRDSQLLGREAPVGAANVSICGQDSVLTARYRDRLFWVWGDTLPIPHPVQGNFKVTAGWSDLPGAGGMDPERGVDLHYIANSHFTKEMVPHPKGHDLHWISSLFVVRDTAGKEHLMAFCSRVIPPLTSHARMLLEYDDANEVFVQVGEDWPESDLTPSGHATRYVDAGIDYLVFQHGGRFIRVPADYDSVRRPEAYEYWTCLPARTQMSDTPPSPTRDAEGALLWQWRHATPATGQQEQSRLEELRHLNREERSFCVFDALTGKCITSHASSVFWNPWRRRWGLILCEVGGKPSHLGELWYAEADRLTGPYLYCCKIVSHKKYSFYNPLQHPEFAKEGGRVIFFEATYTTWFSGVEQPTPRYDYNQIMYKLELDDPRLRLPVAFYDAKVIGSNDSETAGAGICFAAAGGLPRSANLPPPAFFACDMPRTDTVPVYVVGDGEQRRLSLNPDADSTSAGDATPLFHALPIEKLRDSPVLVPLYEYTVRHTGERVYSTKRVYGSPSLRRTRAPICAVWCDPRTLPVKHTSAHRQEGRRKLAEV